MRIDVRKYLFVGLDEDREAFFRKAQDAGSIHFIETSQKRNEDYPQDITDMMSAIKVLRHLPTRPQEELTDYDLATALVYKILGLNQDITNLQEEQRILAMEISRVAIFGDFSLADLRFIETEGHCHIQFFFAKSRAVDFHALPDEVIYVGSEHGLDYFVSINDEPRQYEKLIEMKIDQSEGVLKQREEQVTQELHDKEQRLKSYQKYNTFIHHALIQKLNHFHLHAAQEQVKGQIEGSLFSVEGWVPLNKQKEVLRLCEKIDIHAEEIAIEPTDIIPTYIENKGIHKVGEDVMRIYDTPSINDKDPSLWVLGGFTVFFALIIGDAGYGAILLMLALYLWYRFPKLTGLKRRMLTLFTILCASVIVWGVLTNSFFGISIAANNPIRKFSLVHWLAEKKAAYHMAYQDETYHYWVKKYPSVEDAKSPSEFFLKGTSEKNGVKQYDILSKFSDYILFELAIFIGVLHIIAGYLRYLNRNPIGIGWIAVIIGAYLYFPHYLNVTSLIHYALHVPKSLAYPDGLYLIFGGIAIAVLLSVIKNKLSGLLEVMNVIQIFADVLSYLRLYAFGLAGAIIMSILNEYASNSTFVVAFFLLLLGHAINLVLSVQSGVIHGLRLNFIEWYHYSFEGGGKEFKPLKKIKIE